MALEISGLVKKLLDEARSRNASDVHICSGSPVLYRIGKQLVPATVATLDPESSKKLSFELLTEEQKSQFEKQLDYDLMLADEKGRYRVNISYNDGKVGAVIRILSQDPKAINELYLPPIVEKLAHETKGLILITGSTSQGKTTTLSAMVDYINHSEKKSIITIEDPIEYVHQNKKSMIKQREVGRDTKTFSSGLRAALRQDPDVIGIGEMRDYDTIKTALNAAETGVLVLSTLHIISIDKIIERILSYAPSDEENHIKYLLADSLKGVIHQELLPTLAGGKRVACEVLINTDASKNIIRGKGTFLLRNVMTTGSKHGMITMKQSIEKLLADKLISEDVARGILVNYQT